jgi:hypothetical protein
MEETHQKLNKSTVPSIQLFFNCFCIVSNINCLQGSVFSFSFHSFHGLFTFITKPAFRIMMENRIKKQKFSEIEEI